MAITKVSRGLLSTGISDSSDATAITIDSSENVGFSITPESHYSDYTNLDFGKTGLLLSASSGTNITSLLNNAYLNASTTWKYKEADEASKYDQTGGTHLWFTAPTGGSADADLTWTQRLRVDSDGLKFGSDTAAANALDDYEEGTWTPTMASGGSITNHAATYTKIGRQVTAYMFSTISPTNNSTQFRIGGLPYNTVSTTNYYPPGSIGYTSDFNGSFLYNPLTHYSQSYIYFHKNNGSATAAYNSEMQKSGGMLIILSVTYDAA